MRVERVVGFAVSLLVGVFAVAEVPKELSVVRGFCLPIFDEGGAKTWIVSGEEARGKDEAVVEVTSPQVVGCRDGVRARSGWCDLDTEQKRAQSDSWLRIEGEAYEVTGQGWRWTSEGGGEFEILNDVRVVFR